MVVDTGIVCRRSTVATKVVLMICCVLTIAPVVYACLAFVDHSDLAPLEGQPATWGYYPGEDTAGARLSRFLRYLYMVAPFRHVSQVVTVLAVCAVVKDSKSKMFSGWWRSLAPLDGQYGASFVF
mmetsp:Transcript_9632/g.24631  ORF Transcript_9632/g.24631 Transcript_9632/m.24631 type:complete len:125 (-) Transcript_9632:180-554(-)